MAKKFDATVLLEYIRRSGLVPDDRLRSAVADLEAQFGGQLPEDAHTLADQFVALELLTRWQADNLLRGKFKGYFLGKFKLLGLLGSGGMSSVYLAEHTWMQRKQAIKVLPKKRVGDASYLERFRLEALATASLNHPHIVRLYDIDQEGDVHYLVMEYVRGDNLQAVVARGGPLAYIKAADYVAQAARGLQYAHDAKMVHRDVKPANLLLDDSGTIKLLDLGLALMQGGDAASLTLLHHESVLGTADYLAPEQALNSHDVDFRADIYGLGCTLYFLLTGHPPFPDGTLAQRISKHLTQSPPDLRLERPDCPSELVAACVRMTHKDPSQRFQSMQAVAETLEAWFHEQQGSHLARDEAGTASGGRIAVQPVSVTGRPSGDSPRADVASELPVPESKRSSQVVATASTGPVATPSDPHVGREPRVLQGTMHPSGHGASKSAEPGDSGRLDLGVEGFATAESSAEMRQIREHRRQRQQRREKIFWRVGLGAVAVLALVSLILLFSQLFKPQSNRRTPRDAPPLILKPRGK